MANCKLDTTRLGPRLYQGSVPLPGHEVRDCGFDVLVLAAREWQPADSLYPGVEVVRARLDDSGRPMTSQEWNDAKHAAQVVANAVARKRRVLTTCIAGRNRSGLVNALSLYILTGKPGATIINHIQTLRKNALQNRYFTNALLTLPAR